MAFSVDRLRTAFQYVLPQHALSRVVGKLAASTTPWIKDTFISRFAERYQVDMSEALEPDLSRYACFNDFFTRALKPGARSLCTEADSILCPADGAISQLGPITADRVFQAKGHDYSLGDLLADEQAAKAFVGGQFATVYLSPRDYHRVHMPLSGRLTRSVYVPGDLFSVNTLTAQTVPNLFARNERLVAHFDTEAGPMVVILVGAMIVASIETVWGGVEAIGSRIRTTDFTADQAITLNSGDELGRFRLGSTAIVLFGPDVMAWEASFVSGSPTRMGQRLGHLHDKK
ncbi:phosphatidylserine decarboxylase [Paraperlucidibaca baekdonensis]|uniref:Phosphatidylserine decarboxylase proenzyme n=1 Tax=Paraperlucidibaca baekdonensis TaxID=748120 RepID=A0A3E0HA30_9GAMM|nr:archaetidylserine decarboxylase [Paraperlucidibaca baekdonensis]REH40400.1 phosphatidylserine decarboxylase [Paraperlucidibaca baekdonensis]